MFKRLLVSLSLFLVLFLNTAPFFPSHAQSPAGNPFTTGNETWYTQSFPTWFVKVFDDTNPTEIFGERYTAAQVQWVVFSLASMILSPINGIVRCAFTLDLTQCKQAIDDAGSGYVAYLPKQEKQANRSYFEVISSRNDLSGIGYVKNLMGKFNPIPAAYAQNEGFGYRSMGIIRDLWQAIRDFAFGLVVIVALYYSFMIMLRQKISPQAVISIETAIPKLIITILLVTFSYAIAGFLIDLMYVAGGLVAFLIPRLLGASASSVTGDVYWQFFVASTGAIGAVAFFFYYFLLFVLASFVSLVALATSGPANAILSLFLGVVGLFVLLGIVIVLFINLFKVLFMMIKTVANIYISIIFAPLQLAFSGVAKSSSPVGWIMNLVANLAVFPLMLVFLILGMYFLLLSFQMSGTTIGTGLAQLLNPIALLAGISIKQSGAVLSWSPPFLGYGWDGFIFIGISFTLISALPKAAEMAKSAIMKGTMDFESGIGESMKMVPRGISGAVNIGKVGKEGWGQLQSLLGLLAATKAVKKAVPGNATNEAGGSLPQQNPQT